MKPFNLEEFKAGKLAVSRDGCNTYRFLGVINSPYPLACAKDSAANHEIIVQRHLSGLDAGVPANDLFMKTEKKSGWLILYPPFRKDAVSNCSCMVHKTREEAVEWAAVTSSGIAYIEWEE